MDKEGLIKRLNTGDHKVNCDFGDKIDYEEGMTSGIFTTDSYVIQISNEGEYWQYSVFYAETPENSTCVNDGYEDAYVGTDILDVLDKAYSEIEDDIDEMDFDLYSQDKAASEITYKESKEVKKPETMSSASFEITSGCESCCGDEDDSEDSDPDDEDDITL